MIAAWAFEKGKDHKVIEKVTKDGETAFAIRDYDALRKLFGELLREVQRIKSEGDFAAGKALVEGYGVAVDAAIHEEVLRRYKQLGIAPYAGFIQPRLVAILDDKQQIVDVKIEYPDDFAQQMLEYGKKYSTLPTYP
jgi:dipeptidyl-peptidase-3